MEQDSLLAIVPAAGALLRALLFLLPFFGPQIVRGGARALSGVKGLGKIPGATGALGSLADPKGISSQLLGFGGGFGASEIAGNLLLGNPEDTSDEANFSQLLNQLQGPRPLADNDSSFLKLLQQQQVQGNLAPALTDLGVR